MEAPERLEGYIPTIVRPSVYRSPLGKVWVVDRHGGFDKYSMDLINREGFRSYEAAVARALEVAQERWEHALRHLRRHLELQEMYGPDED